MLGRSVFLSGQPRLRPKGARRPPNLWRTPYLRPYGLS